MRDMEGITMTMTKIVITGGPGAGKTAAMTWVRDAFTKLGYTVIFVPETATELISGGVAPWTCGTNLDYQKCQMRMQLFKEDIFEQGARSMNAKKLLLVCDRGSMDNRCYMTDGEFQQLLSELGTTETALRDRYDAVFHLVTAAKGAKEHYTLDNNAARIETEAQAIELDDRGIAAWTGHPHFRVIGNREVFEDKMQNLIDEIMAFLGEPEPLEIERKFLIAYPDLSYLASLPNCRKVDIRQTYLREQNDEHVRVRARGEAGSYTYFKTTKRTLTDMTRIEVEQRLTEAEYNELLGDADPERRPIEKTRWCLTWDEQYFEIDVFPFWDDKAFLEIELKSESQEVRLPPWIHVIKEVTGDRRYNNSALAKELPE